MANHPVVCIARQFGSGGREIGYTLSKALSVPFYDKELLKAAADKSGIMQELFEKSDEKPVSAISGTLPGIGSVKAANFADYTAYQPNDQLQRVISDVIAEAAEEASCVIIGRCADYILRGRKNVLSVFVHAPVEMRVKRISRLHNLDEDAARALIRKTDRSRANYYTHYTEREWNAADNYHLAIDAGRLGIDKSVELLQTAVGLYCQQEG